MFPSWAALLLSLALPLSLTTRLSAQEAAEKLLDLASTAPSSKQVTVTPSTEADKPGVVVTIVPGEEGYPGVKIKPQGYLVWNLAAFGHIEAKIHNEGTKGIYASLRVDNDGDWKKNPWNTESVSIKPGESKSVSVIFGYSHGKKPDYPLNPAEISNLLVFTGKTNVEQKFRIEYIKAAGPAGQKPAEDPKSVRIKPVDGAVLTATTKVEGKGGAEGALAADGKSVEVTLAPKQSVLLKPEKGRWDFRDGHQIRVKLKNAGSERVSPRVRVSSGNDHTDVATTASPLAPGASGEIIASFIPKEPWTGESDPGQEKRVSSTKYWEGIKGSGTKFISDAVSAVEILADEKVAKQSLVIESVQLAAPPVETPAWLGKRPPVEGDWEMTFQDEFEGTEIDLSKWNVYTANYWDKKTWFSKDNVIVENGVAKLRYEKKTGRHNDDPNGKEFHYASGYLDTYGKWVQRYGYFEARVKLPRAPGLWPAYWTMPDRGIEVGEQWKRASTENGGMEFDIMEHLTRWGPYRFNEAFHWDGYGKAHQAVGTSQVYAGHDKEGFITSGLLWTPGSAVYYCNGEVVGRWDSPRINVVESYPIFYMVSGGWDNNSLDDKQLPVDYEIDYMRVWQRKDLASPVDGVQSTQRTLIAPTTPDPK